MSKFVDPSKPKPSARKQLVEAQEALEQFLKRYQHGGKHGELEEELLNASIIFKECESHLEYVKCQKWLAQIYIDTQQFNTALELLGTSLPYAIQYLGEKNSETGQLYDRFSRCYEHLSDYKMANHYAFQCLAIAQIPANSVENPSYLWSIYMLISTLQNKMGDINQSVEYALKALSFGNKSWAEDGNDQRPWGERYLTFANCAYHLSYVYKEKGDYSQQFQYLNKGLLVIQNTLGEKHLMNAYFYTPLAHYYSAIGDLDLAVLYLQKSLDIQKNNLPSNHWRVSAAHNNVGEILYRMKRYDEALLSTNEAYDSLRNKFGNEHIRVSKSLKILGKINFALKQQSEATHCMQEALQIICKHFGEVHQEVAATYSELAKYSIDSNQKKKFWQKAIDIQRQSSGDKHPQLSAYYCSMARYYFGKSTHVKALTVVQKAINSLFLNGSNTDIRTLPPPHSSLSKPRLLEALALKASILYQYFLKNKQAVYLQSALQHYKRATKLIRQIRQNYRTDFSKLILSQTAVNLCEGGIATSLSANALHINEIYEPLDKAFYFSENAKALLLLDSQQDTLAKITANIPEELQSEEKKLHIELTYLEKNIQKQKARGEEKDEELIQKMQNSFFDFHQKYLQLLQQLETNHPDYYQLKYDTKTITPAELKSILTDNQIVISYFVGQEKLSVFVITSDDFEVIDLQKPNDLEEIVKGFIDNLTQHLLTNFIQKSHLLYQLLITPIRDFIVDDFVLKEEEKELKQVFVIPHDVLNYLPFEALILPPSKENFFNPSKLYDNWTDLDYLLHDCEISYHYSATLLYRHLLKKQTEEEHPSSFAGFAPIYDHAVEASKKSSNSPSSNDALQQSAMAMQSWATRSEAIRSDGTWVSLPHSEMEAKGIAELFEKKGLKSQFFLRKEASKKEFAEAAKQFKFLLVAAHGLVNDEKTALSGLVFYPSDGNRRQDVGSKKRDLGNKQRSVIDKTLSPASYFLHPTSQTDSVLSMEETHHLDLQADLVVLSSCESGIGTLHKGEGMMAVNRGFLAAGANNVVSTLFKVYDKPSSLLTQYLFEAILEGEEYASALRLAKLKLMQQPNIDPKSWSGFVLIGG